MYNRQFRKLNFFTKAHKTMKKCLFWKLTAVFTILTITGCSVLSPYSSYFQGVKSRLEQGVEINAKINENQDSLLHISAQNNVVREVSYLLEQGANPNQKNKFGLAPLHYVLDNNIPNADSTQAKIITLLSSYGAEIDPKNTNGKTTLITAIQENKLLSVKALLKANTDISITYQGNTPLILAVQTGNLEIVENLLTKPQKINIKNSKDQTALHYTALAESQGTDSSLAEIAKTLITYGAKLPEANKKSILNTAIENQRPLVAKELLNSIQSINTPDRDLFSPLMTAVYDGNLTEVRHILDSISAPDINLQDARSWSALHISAHRESKGTDKTQTKITKALIKAGADINLQGPNGNTALHIAISNERTRIVETLLDEKADITLQNNEKETALIKAIQFGQLDTIEKTISPDTINLKDKYGWPPLHFAVNLQIKEPTEQQKIIDLLIESGAQPNLQDQQGLTALHLGIKNKNLLVVSQLLNHNADTTIKDNEGRTALMFASTQDNIDILKSLIVIPQDLNTLDKNGWTAIHHASNQATQRNDNALAEAVKILINAGADTNIQTSTLSSALHYAVQKNHPHVTEVLSKADAKAYLKDNNGITPLILAVENGNYPIVERLTQKAQNFDVQQNDGWTALHFAAHSGNKIDDDYTQSKIAKAILATGANVDIQIPTGETALSIAIGNNKTLVAKTLLEANAKTDIKDNNGWTPLMLAVYLGRIDIIKDIVNRPGNIDTKNSDGMTALHLTANSSSSGGEKIQTQIAKLLLYKGANPNVRAIDGSTALHFAAANNRESLVKALLAANASKRLKNQKGWEARDEAIKAQNTYISKLLK